MNNKKLKITESQYDRLLRLMTEAPYEQMVKQDIQVGDVIKIEWKNSVNNFKVIDVFSGQIIMDNIDKGSTNINNRYLISYTSLNGDDLSLKKINKVKDADKLNDIKNWELVNVNDITNFQIFRDGQLIDSVDDISPTPEKLQKKQKDVKNINVKPDFMDSVNNDLATIIENLGKEKGLNIHFKSGYINFCCFNSLNQEYILEINKDENNILPSINKWDKFILTLKGNPDNDNLFIINKDIVTTNDGVTYNLKFKVSEGVKNSVININGIEGISVLPDCNSSNEDMGDENSESDETDEEEILFNAEKSLEFILKNKDFQDAMYKQPTFWERFKADLQNKKANGTGMITIPRMVSKFTNKLVTDRVGKGFINNNQAMFVPNEPIVVKYRDDNDVIHNYELPMREDQIRVRKHEIDDVTKVLQKKIPDSNLNLRILVKDKTDEPNVKLCDVQVGILQNEKKFISKGETKDVKIKFLDSEGYNANKDIETNK